jgi:hypothetical protein
MRQLVVAVTLVLGVAFSVVAQTTATPNFSGTWVLNSSKSTLAKDDTIKSETIVIEYKKSTIVFHYKTDGAKSTEKFTPDGQKRVTMNTASGQLTSRASWQDSVLVIESTLQVKVPNVVVTVTGLKPLIDRWSLAPDGLTLTHGAGDPKEVFVYDKQ